MTEYHKLRVQSSEFSQSSTLYDSYRRVYTLHDTQNEDDNDDDEDDGEGYDHGSHFTM